MTSRLPLIFFLMLTTSLTGWAQSASVSNHDTQAWPEIYVAKKFRERVAVVGFTEIHIGRNASTPVEEQVGAGITYSPNAFVSVVPFYRWVATQPLVGRPFQESRPQLDVILHIPLPVHFAINDRNRCEFRWINGKASQRYGNRVQFERPMTVLHKGVIPFAGVEWFYDTRFDAWNRTRYSLGLRLPINPHLDVAPYYLRQNDSRAVPGHVNAVAMIVHVQY